MGDVTPDERRWMLYPSTRLVGPKIDEVTEVAPVSEVERLHDEWTIHRRTMAAELDRLRAALERIRALWTDPAPAQRQDVAFQRAVGIASEALDAG